MQYLPVTNKMFGCCWKVSLLSYWWYQFFSVNCFLSKANRSPIHPYLLKNTTTSLCVAVQIRKKEHFCLHQSLYEQLIKCSHSWNTLNRKLGFINEWCTKWQSLALMYVIRINQWDNRFDTSNLFFSTSRMLTFYTAGKVHKPIKTKCS